MGTKPQLHALSLTLNPNPITLTPIPNDVLFQQQQLQRTELEPISSQEAMNGATDEFQACIQERNCKEESAEGEEDVVCLCPLFLMRFRLGGSIGIVQE